MTKKILIVEDEETILELLSVTLSDLRDCCILLAKDGEEGLKTARAANPDIILLDVGLPNVNGLEVCRSLKSDSATSHTKILMISGMGENTEQKAREAGADVYVAKPFSLVSLVEKVEELLDSN